MRNKKFIFLVLLFLTSGVRTIAQISQGGEPLPVSMLRSARSALFTEMEPVDNKALLHQDSLENRTTRSVRFAHKFYTDLRPDNSGIRFTLADGTKVWQCGIRSAGAYSINLLFTEYHLPKGAKLFIYNSSRTHKIGAFTDYNNSSYNRLPTAPVYGDEIIVEYQEPANAEFKGQIAIGEVNHDYKGITLRSRPGSLSSTETCHKEAACFPQYDDQTQAVTLLIIDGNEYCTGCLVNNTEKDKTPYLLSAAHCFLPFNGVPSETRAQNSIIFFNYQSPSCKSQIIGTEEMSMASADLLVNETSIDVALLKLKELPPRYYRPYFAGWNAGSPATSPYFCIHHPKSKTKKITTSVKALTPTTYIDASIQCEPNAHWLVSEWSDGTTEAGSSGAPLFDSEKRVIGALTGGSSYCSSPFDDYFYAFQKVWNRFPEPNRQLKYWLDPKNKGTLQLDGLNPYADSLGNRLSNVGKKESTGVNYLESPESGPLFGHNSLRTSEFGERFITGRQTTLYGVHLVLPQWKSSWSGNVEINVYSGYNKPDLLLATQPVTLNYKNYANGSFTDVNKPNTDGSDNFLKFSSPIVVDYSFFVTIKLQYPSTDTFKIFNVTDRPVPLNTTFLNSQYDGWKPLSGGIDGYPASILYTSLWIDPEVHLGKEVNKLPEDTIANDLSIYYIPNSRILYFKNLSPANNYLLRMYTPMGKMVFAKTLNLTESYFSLNLDTSVPNGVYIIELTNNKKVIKRKIPIFNHWPSSHF